MYETIDCLIASAMSVVKLQPAFLQIAPHQLFEPRLVDGNLALAKLRDSLLVDVHADYFVAAFGIAGATHQSDVSAAYDCDVHRWSLKFFLDYVDRLSLRLVIGAREHLTEQSYTHKLYSYDY